jgi:hypothetical protein
MMWKTKCFVASFKSMTQYWVILQDVFATTFVNSRQFLGYNDMMRPLYTPLVPNQQPI